MKPTLVSAIHTIEMGLSGLEDAAIDMPPGTPEKVITFMMAAEGYLAVGNKGEALALADRAREADIHLKFVRAVDELAARIQATVTRQVAA